MTEAHINFVALNSVSKTKITQERQTVTKNCTSGLRDIVKLNKAVKDELTVTSKSVVLRGTRIVIPQSLQKRAIDIAYIGLTETKALLREKILFPNIDKLVQNNIENHLPCQAQ